MLLFKPGTMALTLTELRLRAKYLLLMFLLHSQYEKQPHYPHFAQELLKLSEESGLLNAKITSIDEVCFRRFFRPHGLQFSPWVLLAICEHRPAVYSFHRESTLFTPYFPPYYDITPDKKPQIRRVYLAETLKIYIS